MLVITLAVWREIVETEMRSFASSLNAECPWSLPMGAESSRSCNRGSVKYGRSTFARRDSSRRRRISASASEGFTVTPRSSASGGASGCANDEH